MPTAPLLLVGFAVAVWMRVAIGGVAVRTSASAGLVFAAALALLTCVSGTSYRISLRALGWGAFGGAVLLLPPLLLHLDQPSHTPGGPYWSWALVVTVVATAEEAFLRGALYDAITDPTTAIVVGSVCFAALHIPLYGWHAVPLDLAVGLWLGALRRTAGTWTASAVCHVLADLGGWWVL